MSTATTHMVALPSPHTYTMQILVCLCRRGKISVSRKMSEHPNAELHFGTACGDSGFF
jgi:hypothetical protein